MNNNRNLIQHSILKLLIEAYKYNPRSQNLPPINDSQILKTSIEFKKLIELIDNPLASECIYELNGTLLTLEDIIINAHPPDERVKSLKILTKNVSITKEGINVFKSGKLKIEEKITHTIDNSQHFIVHGDLTGQALQSRDLFDNALANPAQQIKNRTTNTAPKRYSVLEKLSWIAGIIAALVGVCLLLFK